MNMDMIVKTLRAECARIEAEMRKIGSALVALGAAPKQHSRRMSASARKRISDAQKARWAKTRKAEKVTAISTGWTPRKKAQSMRMKGNRRALTGRRRAA